MSRREKEITPKKQSQQRNRKTGISSNKIFLPPWPAVKEAQAVYEEIRQLPLTEAVEHLRKNPPSPEAIYFLIFETKNRHKAEENKFRAQIKTRNRDEEIVKKWYEKRKDFDDNKSAFARHYSKEWAKGGLKLSVRHIVERILKDV